MTLKLYRDQAATYRNVPPHQLEQQAGAEADLGQHSEEQPITAKGQPSSSKKDGIFKQIKKNIYIQYCLLIQSVSKIIADQLEHSVTIFIADWLRQYVSIFITDQLGQSVSIFITDQLRQSVSVFLKISSGFLLLYIFIAD